MGKKENYQLSAYTEGIHKSGRIWFLGVYLCILLFPIGTSIFFNAWPTWKQFFGAAIGVVPLYWAVGIIETFTYMPMLGPGASYLGFITGNMSNLKVPVAINSMDSVGAKQGTEEADVISTISVAISSIVTVVIIIIFVILMAPLKPIFDNPVLDPAFSNVVPSLFGGLMVAFLAKNVKAGLPIVLLGIILFILFPSLEGIYPVILPVLAAIAVLYSRILYKKGKI